MTSGVETHAMPAGSTHETTPPIASAPAASHAVDAHRGELVVDGVFHHYLSGGRRVDVLDDVSFRVAAGSVACVVGPSGCGKSTLLGLAAGLLSPSNGAVMWDGRPVRLGPNRDLGMAFQQPGLFPWMTVHENVAIGLRTRGRTRRDARTNQEEGLWLATRSRHVVYGATNRRALARSFGPR